MKLEPLAVCIIVIGLYVLITYLLFLHSYLWHVVLLCLLFNTLHCNYVHIKHWAGNCSLTNVTLHHYPIYMNMQTFNSDCLSAA